MTWTFEQATGKLIDPTGEVVATGYAGGNCGQDPQGVNNPELENAKFIGPLPRGLYTIGQPVLSNHLGPFAIPLEPGPLNEMFGRGDFFIHGDRTDGHQFSASEGCVIMPRGIREKIWQSGDHSLLVVRGDSE